MIFLLYQSFGAIYPISVTSDFAGDIQVAGHSGAILVKSRSDGYEDLAERALPSGIVVVTS